jgi:DNA-binding MarR family transcriptional regulator
MGGNRTGAITKVAQSGRVKPVSRRKSSASGRTAPARRRSPAAAGLDLAELNDRVGYFLRRLQVAIFKDFIRTLAPVDVRPAQYSVLVLIAANPGRSQAAIGKALHIERARLARMLHELERRQWIERRLASGDGRSHSLFMTAAGQEAMTRIETLALHHERQMIKFIGQDLRQLLLERLRPFGRAGHGHTS